MIGQIDDHSWSTATYNHIIKNYEFDFLKMSQLYHINISYL